MLCAVCLDPYKFEGNQYCYIHGFHSLNLHIILLGGLGWSSRTACNRFSVKRSNHCWEMFREGRGERNATCWIVPQGFSEIGHVEPKFD